MMNQVHPEIERVKSRRKELKVTQDILAKRARISESYLAQLEVGMRRSPAFDIIKALDDALNAIASDQDGQNNSKAA